MTSPSTTPGFYWLVVCRAIGGDVAGGAGGGVGWGFKGLLRLKST